MIPIAGIAPLNGWKQVGAPHWSFLEQHEFSAEGGQLVHRTNGALRATVPPEGFADYLKLWPEAEPIVRAISGPAPKSASEGTEDPPAVQAGAAGADDEGSAG